MFNFTREAGEKKFTSPPGGSTIIKVLIVGNQVEGVKRPLYAICINQMPVTIDGELPIYTDLATALQHQTAIMSGAMPRRY